MNSNVLKQKAQQLAKNYLSLEKELLSVIINIDKQKDFYQWGYSSLFTYVTQELKLSPATTYNLISVTRKSHEVPQLKEEVTSGRLSIAKAKKMTVVLTQDNHKKWFEVARQSTHRELEREVALASPKSALHEKVKYVALGDKPIEKITIKQNLPRLALQLGVSEELMLKLRRAQDLECQRQKKNLNLEETLEEVLSLFLEKRDPVKKTQRQKFRGKLSKSPPRELLKHTTLVSTGPKAEQNRYVNKLINKKRKALSARLTHQVQLRDNGQCCYQNSKGLRCLSKRYLEVHNIRPLSMGGEDRLENLQLLCSGHHKVIHSKV